MAPVSLAGSAPRCPLPGQEQPFPAAWAPPAPQAPPAGLQRAPCGCWFDAQVFQYQWAMPYGHQGTAVAPAPVLMLTSIPGYQHIQGQRAQPYISSTATAEGTPGGSNISSGSSAAPQKKDQEDPRAELHLSQEMLFGEAHRLFGVSAVCRPGASSSPMTWDTGDTPGEGSFVAPASPPLPMSVTTYEGPVEPQNISGTATTAGTPPGSTSPLGSTSPPSPSAAPDYTAPGDTVGHPAVTEEVPLEEALSFFGCSLDMLGVAQDTPVSSPRPGDPGVTSPPVPQPDFSSLSLPEDLLSPDYTVPELREAMLSMAEFYVLGMEPPELWKGAGMELPLPQAAKAEQRGQKRGQSPSAEPPSKRRALAASRGLGGGN
nr:proline-rich protein 22 isoform X1 [Columba livia]